MREHVIFHPMKAVIFHRLAGSMAMGRIQNIIEEVDGDLKLRFAFDFDLANCTPEQEAEFEAAMEKDYYAAVQTTLDRIRGEIAQTANA